MAGYPPARPALSRVSSITAEIGGWKLEVGGCLSSIILSPLNGNVKMSPHETGDIHVESEGTAEGEGDQCLHQGRLGVCQSRRTPVSERADRFTVPDVKPREKSARQPSGLRVNGRRPLQLQNHS